jgi:hypothetical protein
VGTGEDAKERVMDGWDVAIMIVAGYVAVTALVRLMLHRRDRLVEQFRAELAARKRTAAPEKAQP